MGRGKRHELIVKDAKDVRAGRHEPELTPHLQSMRALNSSSALALPPGSPDWAELERLPWLKELADCRQEPAHHGEGDVLAHTKLVVAALLEDEDFAALDDQSRHTLYLAALLHDVGKPETTREEEGRLVSPGHSRRGSIKARRILWEAGFEPILRERVCALVRHHMAPYFLVQTASKDPSRARRRALEISLTAGCDRLAILSRADGRGRISTSRDDLELRVGLYAAYCEELGCLNSPYPFPSDHSRFLYFRREDRDPSYLAFDDTRSRVLLLSGLPAAGKDSYLKRAHPSMPFVSLDALRRELGVSATDNQGTVLQLAKERAREHLRAGDDFAWNAITISRSQREPLLSLFADYHARVDVVQIEVPAAEHASRNQSRGLSAVPVAAIERMLGRWESPDLTECHSLTLVG